MRDHTLGDAMFLHSYPSWSQRDLNEADQDVVDYLSAISREQATHSREQHLQGERESWAARNRVPR